MNYFLIQMNINKTSKPLEKEYAILAKIAVL